MDKFAQIAVAGRLEEIALELHALAVALNAETWEPTEHPVGSETGLRSADGQPLRVGERVQVTDSERYGDAFAIVKGIGPNLGDGKQRVHVALEDGQDDTYTPSVGRIVHAPVD